MLSDPVILEALQLADETLPEACNPFMKVNTLYRISAKANSQERLLLAIVLMTKLVANGVMHVSDFVSRKLRGLSDG